MTFETAIRIFNWGLLVLGVAVFFIGYRKAKSGVNAGTRFHSRPAHYGGYVFSWFAVPFVGICVIGGLINLICRAREVGGLPASIILTLAFVLGLAGAAFGFLRIRPELRARNGIEKVIHVSLIGASLISILITFGIVASILFGSIEFFAGSEEHGRDPVSPIEFLTGTTWAPSGGAELKFGAVPLFAGTFMITMIAMLVAVPIGLFSAIYMAEYLPNRLRKWVKPILEILAGIPTVVYGFFAVVTVAPMVVELSNWMADDVLTPGTWLSEVFAAATHENALTCGLVMGIMVIPLISSLSDDVINSVPQSLREGSLALGMTRAETIRKVVLPAALPGIASAVLLAISRALGETMIVYMAAGLSPNLSANPLEGMTTVTVRIVNVFQGDEDFKAAEPLSAYALGLTLFLVTLILNVGATIIVRRFRQRYEL